MLDVDRNHSSSNSKPQNISLIKFSIIVESSARETLVFENIIHNMTVRFIET